jgi:hypothetical protein
MWLLKEYGWTPGFPSAAGPVRPPPAADGSPDGTRR